MGSSPTLPWLPHPCLHFHQAVSCSQHYCPVAGSALWFCTSYRLCWAARGCRRGRNPHGRRGHSASGVQGPRGCRGCSPPRLALWGQGEGENGTWVVLETVQAPHVMGLALSCSRMRCLLCHTVLCMCLAPTPKTSASIPKIPVRTQYLSLCRARSWLPGLSEEQHIKIPSGPSATTPKHAPVGVSPGWKRRC